MSPRNAFICIMQNKFIRWKYPKSVWSKSEKIILQKRVGSMSLSGPANTMSPIVLLLRREYRLGHPTNCLYYRGKNEIGSKYPKIVSSNFENKIIAHQPPYHHVREQTWPPNRWRFTRRNIGKVTSKIIHFFIIKQFFGRMKIYKKTLS